MSKLKIGQYYISDRYITQESKRCCTLFYFLQGVHSLHMLVILTVNPPPFQMTLSHSLHFYGI